MTFRLNDVTRAGAVLGLLLLCGAGEASPDDPLRRLSEARAEAVRTAARIRDLDKAAQAAVDDAARLRAREAALAGRVQQSEAVLATAEARVALVDSLIAARRHRLAERQGKIVNLLAALESLSRRPPLLALAQPGSIKDTARVAMILDGVLPVIRERTTDLRAEIQALQILRTRAGEARQQVLAARAGLEDSRKLLGDMEQQRQSEARKFATRSMLESDRALALSVEAKDLRQLLGGLDAQARLRQRLAGLPGPLPRPAVVPAYALPPADARIAMNAPAPEQHLAGGFIMPVLGEVTTGFGELSAAGIRSRGLTLRTRPKAQVVAPAAGRIVFAGPFREYGNIVIVEHDGEATTLLAGLGVLDAKAGQKVASGGPLGRMGSRTRDLTIEVRRNGEPVNPLPLMTSR